MGDVISVLVLLAVLFVLGLSVASLCSFVRTGTPPISSGRKSAERMVKLSQGKTGDTAIDLGAGVGQVVAAAQRAGLRITGYEMDLFPYTLARLRRLPVCRKDFFTVDVQDVDIVFCYLFPHVMLRIADEIWPKMKPGARLVSHAFVLPGAEPSVVDGAGGEKIYVYIKP